MSNKTATNILERIAQAYGNCYSPFYDAEQAVLRYTWGDGYLHEFRVEHRPENLRIHVVICIPGQNPFDGYVDFGKTIRVGASTLLRNAEVAITIRETLEIVAVSCLAEEQSTDHIVIWRAHNELRKQIAYVLGLS